MVLLAVYVAPSGVLWLNDEGKLGDDWNSGFVPFLTPKIQGLFKDFQGYISHFQGLHAVQKRALSPRLF